MPNLIGEGYNETVFQSVYDSAADAYECGAITKEQLREQLVEITGGNESCVSILMEAVCKKTNT